MDIFWPNEELSSILDNIINKRKSIPMQGTLLLTYYY